MYVLHTHRLLKQTSDARAGMREFEILSRSSATLVALSGNDDSRLGFLGPRHVTEPWHYRNYYNLDWLQFVNSSHVKIFLGSRGVHAVARSGGPSFDNARSATGIHDEVGALVARLGATQTRCHASLDLVLLELDGDRRALDDCLARHRRAPATPVDLRHGRMPHAGDRVTCIGHVRMCVEFCSTFNDMMSRTCC